MESRGSLIELLEDLTTGGKDSDRSKKTIESNIANKNSGPKVFEYDHKLKKIETKNYNHQPLEPKSNDPLSQYPRSNYYQNEAYHSTSWPPNYSTAPYPGPTGFNSPNVTGYSPYNNVHPPPAAADFTYMQQPFDVGSKESLSVRHMSPSTFQPNTSAHENFSPSRAPSLPISHFNYNHALPAHFYQQPYHEYVSGSYPIPKTNFQTTKVEENVMSSVNMNLLPPQPPILNECKPSLTLNLNQLHPPPPPVLKEPPIPPILHKPQPPPVPPNLIECPPPLPPNLKEQAPPPSNLSEHLKRKYSSSNTNCIFPISIDSNYNSEKLRGPRTPPLPPNTCSTTPSINKSYTMIGNQTPQSIKGPRTPPLPVKGPHTPPPSEKDLCTTLQEFKGPVISKVAKEFQTPQSVKGISTPQSVKGISTPQSVKGISTPQAMKEPQGSCYFGKGPNIFPILCGPNTQMEQSPQAQKGSKILENIGLPTPKSRKGLPTPKSEEELPTPKSGRGLPTPKIEKSLYSPQIGKGLHTPKNGKGLHTPKIEKGFHTPQIVKGHQSSKVRKGPRTPPEIVKGPRTPPEIVKGPHTPPEVLKGPHTPPEVLKGPHTPPEVLKAHHAQPEFVKRPYTPPVVGKGPHTPPEVGKESFVRQVGKESHIPHMKRSCISPSASPCAPLSKGHHAPPVPSHDTQSFNSTPSLELFGFQSFPLAIHNPPLPPSPLVQVKPSKPPEPKEPPPNSSGVRLKIIHRSEKSSSSDSESSVTPDTSYPDYKRKLLDSPDHSMLSKKQDNEDLTRIFSKCGLSKSTTDYIVKLSQLNDSPKPDKLLSPNNENGCSNYFYGSSFFIDCDEIPVRKQNSNKNESKTSKKDSKKKKKKKKKAKKIKDRTNKKNKETNELELNSELMLKDTIKHTKDVLKENEFFIKNIAKKGKHILSFSDTSSDSDGSNVAVSNFSNQNDDEPFIKYSDYEELLNLESKRLTMECESAQEVTYEIDMTDDTNPLVDLPSDGSPILYDLPEDSPPVLDSTDVKDKPKYPRYFKDKVAYSSSLQPHFTEIPLHNNSDIEYDEKKNDFNSSLVFKEPLPKFGEETINAVPCESTKAIKTPLIKRLGLVEDIFTVSTPDVSKINIETQNKKNDSCKPIELSSMLLNEEIKSNTVSDEGANEKKIIERDVIQENLLIEEKITETNLTAKEEIVNKNKEYEKEAIQNRPNELLEKETLPTKLHIEKEPQLAVRKLVIVEDQQGKLTKVKLASPTNSENLTPFSVLQRESKVLPSSSIKNKENDLFTPKGRGSSHRLSEMKNVKESPSRLDLDSRIKILFGMKNDSPQKLDSENFESPPKYHYKNHPPLPRPPSPFKNKNLYLYWHRESYYFRKNNPIPPPGSIDPKKRRKIGIQINDQSSISLENKSKAAIKLSFNNNDKDNSKSSLDQLRSLDEMNYSPKDNLEIADDNYSPQDQQLDSPAIKITIPQDQNLQQTQAFNKTNSPHNTSTSSDLTKITRIDVLPNNELELVSESAELELNTHLDSSEDPVNYEQKSENVIQMVIAKLIEDLKESLKRKLTDCAVNDDTLKDFMPYKLARRE